MIVKCAFVTIAIVFFRISLLAQTPVFVEKEKVAPEFLLEDCTPKEFRQKQAKNMLAWAHLAKDQRDLVQRAAKGSLKDAFPYWAYKVRAGNYRMVFKSADALWENRMKVGSVKSPGQQKLDTEFGYIDNRNHHKSVVFSLKEPTIVRFEAWAKIDNRSWRMRFSCEARSTSQLSFSNEDGVDEDFNDMMVYFEEVPGTQ